MRNVAGGIACASEMPLGFGGADAGSAFVDAPYRFFVGSVRGLPACSGSLGGVGGNPRRTAAFCDDQASVGGRSGNWCVYRGCRSPKCFLQFRAAGLPAWCTGTAYAWALGYSPAGVGWPAGGCGLDAAGLSEGLRGGVFTPFRRSRSPDSGCSGCSVSGNSGYRPAQAQSSDICMGGNPVQGRW